MIAPHRKIIAIINAVLRWVVMVALLFNGVTVVVRTYAKLVYPYELDYGEGHVLSMISLLAERGTYFLSIHDYPFIHGIYGPVFHLLSLPLYYLIGPSLLPPRLVATASAAILLVILYLLIQRLTRERLTSLLLTLLFLAPWFVQGWIGLGRVDMLAILFSVAGISVFDYYDRTKSPKRYWSFALFMLAFFTKHSIVAAPAAVFLYALFVKRERRYLLFYLAAYFIPVFALLVVGNIFTKGEFLRHLFSYNVVPFFWEYMIVWYRQFLLLTAPILLFIWLGIMFAWREIWRRHAVFLFYFLLTVLSLVTSAKSGANYNYLIEPYIVTLLFLAVAARALRHHLVLSTKWTEISLVLALVLFFQTAGMTYLSSGYAFLTPPTLSSYRFRIDAKINALVQQTPGDILSENMSVLVANRREVFYEPFQFFYLAWRQLWRSDKLLTDCRARRFKLIITDWRISYLPGMTDCMMRYYKLISMQGSWLVLEPRSDLDLGD
jgi:hypothetical protein